MGQGHKVAGLDAEAFETQPAPQVCVIKSLPKVSGKQNAQKGDLCRIIGDLLDKACTGSSYGCETT